MSWECFEYTKSQCEIIFSYQTNDLVDHVTFQTLHDFYPCTCSPAPPRDRTSLISTQFAELIKVFYKVFLRKKNTQYTLFAIRQYKTICLKNQTVKNSLTTTNVTVDNFSTQVSRSFQHLLRKSFKINSFRLSKVMLWGRKRPSSVKVHKESHKLEL